MNIFSLFARRKSKVIMTMISQIFHMFHKLAMATYFLADRTATQYDRLLA